MSRIFLGPMLHWLIVVVLVGLGWLAGQYRLHVSFFNVFVTLLVLVSVAVVLLVLATSRSGRQVTRDELHDPETD